ncbi:Unknown protein sequence [Pseudomonas amygdali pv. aesculi]|nr:Unknown protein sequence [Pseudomonas amygdali pv. aesculi]
MGNAAEFRIDPGEQAHDLVFVADVRLQGDRLSTQGPDLPCRLFGCGMVRQIIDTDPIALYSGQTRSGCADSARATGNNEDFFHDFSQKPASRRS